MNNIIIVLIGILVAIPIAGWLGLQVKPNPFPAYPEQPPALETIELPEGLPSPVERFYKTIYGDRIPVIESAVISGRAKVRLFGISFPSRFRFTHVAGQGYRHYIETTIFGIPLASVNEYYLDGNARMETPGGVIENEPKIDQAANLGLWAESVWLPSIFLTDPRVRWEAVDDNTALLIVPFDQGEDTLTVTFDPETGLISTLEAMRYREATDEAKILWHDEVMEWQYINGYMLPTLGTVTWMDQGKPVFVFTFEDVVYNVGVSEYIRASGP